MKRVFKHQCGWHRGKAIVIIVPLCDLFGSAEGLFYFDSAQDARSLQSLEEAL
ncbi:hypothetical protein HMP0721_2225 [Pseudoramibacter alactolyticus ATCC 23263]|uniref:Uncharacterized protein n=1 Tax=Pseudoramibacter alactolyticus ATCC 23263 TaxID=887929 RepID=E6MJP0_9FIRM|nr:hypothetical protein HMP0721_2225 [Pseudoramibacter alactolyticus ATCC 23263]